MRDQIQAVAKLLERQRPKRTVGESTGRQIQAVTKLLERQGESALLHMLIR